MYVLELFQIPGSPVHAIHWKRKISKFSKSRLCSRGKCMWRGWGGFSQWSAYCVRIWPCVSRKQEKRKKQESLSIEKKKKKGLSPKIMLKKHFIYFLLFPFRVIFAKLASSPTTLATQMLTKWFLAGSRKRRNLRLLQNWMQEKTSVVSWGFNLWDNS